MEGGGKGDIHIDGEIELLTFHVREASFLTLRFGLTQLFSLLKSVLGRTGSLNDGRAIH